MAQKLTWMAKIPISFYWSNMIMPYEYPVNWDALILLYQGTTSWFNESKTLKMAIFQPKMAQKWPLIAKIWRSQFSCIFQSHRHGILCFFFFVSFSRKNLLINIACFENFQKSKEKGCFWMAKLDSLTNLFHLFFTHLLGLSESYILDPWTLIQDSKWGFPVMIDPKWSFLCGSKQ